MRTKKKIKSVERELRKLLVDGNKNLMESRIAYVVESALRWVRKKHNYNLVREIKANAKILERELDEL